MNTHTLTQFERNVFSQGGEDGILEHVLGVLGIENGWCVEFGAWDGKHLSNTYKLMQEGWSGVFIEGDSDRYKDLCATYSGNKKAHPVLAFVNFEGPNSLDGILSKTSIPKSFGVLSIDIDGNDYHIWASLKKFSPEVIIIEYNPAIPPHVSFVQPKDMRVNQGNSLKALVELGKQKGYELIVTTQTNAFFVKKESYTLFGIENNSPEVLFRDPKYLMDVFQLYDGTLMFTGAKKMFWHNITIPAKFQPIPKVFRIFPSVMSPVRLFLFRVWKKLSGR